MTQLTQLVFCIFAQKLILGSPVKKFSKTYFRIISFSEKNAIIILNHVFKSIGEKVKEFFIECQAHAYEGI